MTGAVMTGGWESFGGTGSQGPPWGQTAIGRLLPTSDIEGARVESGRLVIIEEGHEFVSSLPWERRSPFMTSWHHNVVAVKQGGRLLAITDRNKQYGDEHPLFIAWEIPEGSRVFACAAEIEFMAITDPWKGTNFLAWDYYGDFSSNMMIYLCKRPLPQDIDLVHSVRSKAFEIRTRSSLLLTMLEFIEKFGANARVLMEERDGISDTLAGARQDYIELRFEEVLETYRETLEEVERLEVKAIEFKERALAWVYIIEWFVVSGALLLSGYFLWSVMVRRSLYREIDHTRMVEVG